MPNPCGPDLPDRQVGDPGHVADHNELHCFFDEHTTDTDPAVHPNKVDTSILAAKGSLYVAIAPGVVTSIGVGADGQVLTADSIEATGVKWATAGGGGGTGFTEPSPNEYLFSPPGVLSIALEGPDIGISGVGTAAVVNIGADQDDGILNITANGPNGLVNVAANGTQGVVNINADDSITFTDSVGALTLDDIRNGLGGGGANIDGAGSLAVAAHHSGGTNTADGVEAVAVGQDSAAAGAGGVAIGRDSIAGGVGDGQAVAVGAFALAGSGSNNAVALGGGPNATAAPQAASLGISIGGGPNTGVAGARVTTASGIAIGTSDGTLAGASAGGNALAIGTGSSATTVATAIGLQAAAGQLYSIAVGRFAATTGGTQTIAIGASDTAARAAAASAQGAVAIGSTNSGTNGAKASAASAIAIGGGDTTNGAAASAANTIAIGRLAIANVTQGIAIGTGSQAHTGVQGIAIGSGTNATAAPVASAQGAIAIGASNGAAINGARANGICSIAIGSGDTTNWSALANADNSIAIGRQSQSGGVESIAIGEATTAASQWGISLGSFVSAGTGLSGVSIGGGSSSTKGASGSAAAAVAIGGASTSGTTGARASGAAAVAIGGSSTAGNGASATGARSVALGRAAVAGHDDAVALGPAATTTAANQIRLGTSAETVSIPGSSNTTGFALHQTPTVRVVKSGAQTIANAPAGGAIVLFDTESFDTDNMHSTVTDTGRITFNTAGVYIVTGCVLFASNATGSRDVWIRLNGGATRLSEMATTSNSTDIWAGSVSAVAKFAATDFVELMIYQSSGGNLDIQTIGTHFSAAYVGNG